MVPEGWTATTLGGCATFRSGGTPSKQRDDYWGGLTPWVSAKDLKMHYIRGAIDHLSESGAAVAKIANPDDVLMLVRGMTLMKDVPIGLVTKPVAFNQDIKALIANNHVNPRYLSYMLVGKKRHMMGLVNTANHGTGRLDTELLKSLPVDLPPLPEQRKIADILSTWDRAIEVSEALLATARRQKRSLMQSLLTGKRRFPEFNGQPWKEVRLGNIGETFTGLTGKTKVDFGDDGYPFITYLNVFQNTRISLKQFNRVRLREGERQNSVQYGDIFLTTSSETPNEVGMSSVLLDDIHGVYLNSFCFGFRLHNFETLLPEFARFLLRGQDFRRTLHRLAQGATRYNLSKAYLLDLLLTIPSVAEQMKIADVLSAAEEEVEKHQNIIHHLRTEKRALMQQLLTGKKRVVV